MTAMGSTIDTRRAGTRPNSIAVSRAITPTNETRPRCANGGSYRDLAFAGGCASEHEVGEIAARHEEHQPSQAEEQRERYAVRFAQTADAATSADRTKSKRAVPGQEIRAVSRR